MMCVFTYILCKIREHKSTDFTKCPRWVVGGRRRLEIWKQYAVWRNSTLDWTRRTREDKALWRCHQRVATATSSPTMPDWTTSGYMSGSGLSNWWSLTSRRSRNRQRGARTNWRSYSKTSTVQVVFTYLCHSFYHAMLHGARCCHGKSSVRPSIRPSVPLTVLWSRRLEYFENNFSAD